MSFYDEAKEIFDKALADIKAIEHNDPAVAKVADVEADAEAVARAQLTAEGKDANAQEIADRVAANAAAAGSIEPDAEGGAPDQSGAGTSSPTPASSDAPVSDAPVVALDDVAAPEAPQTDPAAVMAAQALLEGAGWTVTPPSA